MTTDEIGKLAESIALNYEMSKLDVGSKVRSVSDYPEAGYDIEVLYEHNGTRSLKAIEVKAWNKNGYVHVTKNEMIKLAALGTNGWIYIVDINKRKVVVELNDPFSRPQVLEPSVYKLYF